MAKSGSLKGSLRVRRRRREHQVRHTRALNQELAQIPPSFLGRYLVTRPVPVLEEASEPKAPSTGGAVCVGFQQGPRRESWWGRIRRKRAERKAAAKSVESSRNDSGAGADNGFGVGNDSRANSNAPEDEGSKAYHQDDCSSSGDYEDYHSDDANNEDDEGSDENYLENEEDFVFENPPKDYYFDGDSEVDFDNTAEDADSDDIKSNYDYDGFDDDDESNSSDNIEIDYEDGDDDSDEEDSAEDREDRDEDDEHRIEDQDQEMEDWDDMLQYDDPSGELVPLQRMHRHRHKNFQKSRRQDRYHSNDLF